MEKRMKAMIIFSVLTAAVLLLFTGGEPWPERVWAAMLWGFLVGIIAWVFFKP